MLHRVWLSLALGLVASASSAQTPAVPLLRLERDVYVDAARNDLSPIGWLAVGKDGTIAISQFQDHHLRFFSSRGVATRTFGRKGQGPGEFGAMTLHGWLGDTLWVGDMETSRFTLIGPQGRLVRSEMWPPGVRFPETTPRPHPSFIFAVPWAVYRDGTVLAFAYPSGEVVPDWMQRPAGTLAPFLRLTRDGTYRRTVGWVYSSNPACQIATRAGTSSKPLCFRPFWAVSRHGGIVFTANIERSDAQNDYVRAIAVHADGETLFTTLMSVPRQRIPRSVADSLQSLFSKSSREPTKSVDLPEVFPPFEQAIVAADEKSIWLESGVTTGDRVWRVVDLTGRAVGTVRVPRSVQLRVVSLERVWATERDQDGLESIVVYRLRR
jgi:hypothetical protein